MAAANVSSIFREVEDESGEGILLVCLAGFLFNTIANYVTSKSNAEALTRCEFVLTGILRDSFCVWVRYNVYMNQGLFWCLLWPLTIFETFFTQLMGDRFSGRPLMGIYWTQVCSCLRVTIVEAVGTLFGLHVVGIADPTLPATASTIVSSIYVCPVFDFGLDFGFYVFHRACHKNRYLYKLVHMDHHTDTAKEHGRLVAYETYTITWLETMSITSSYFIGLVLVICLKGVKPLSYLELANLITYGHSVELIGHTAMSSTPKWHPMRLLVELAGFDLHVIDHTMHHKIPLSNFSKRMTFWDVVFGTYSPRDETLVYKAGDENLVAKKVE